MGGAQWIVEIAVWACLVLAGLAAIAGTVAWPLGIAGGLYTIAVGAHGLRRFSDR